ncbi:hypothetical protein Tco_1490413 [Tanacetum coccineum]
MSLNESWHVGKKKCDEENTIISDKSSLVAKGYGGSKREGTILKSHLLQFASVWKRSGYSSQYAASKIFPVYQMGVQDNFLYGTSKEEKSPRACVGTPMATKPLDADLSGTPVDQTKYHSMVGALMYLTTSRPDIVHATCYCARYQARPTEKHLKEVKRIIRYLKNTINMGLWYPKDTDFELTAVLDSDHAGYLDSRKSTSGGIQFLGGDKLISWSSKKQDYTSMSSAEAEYVSLSACCAQVLWLRTLLKDYSFHFDKIPMCCDSKAAIAISGQSSSHSRTKHIDVKYHFIKEHSWKMERISKVKKSAKRAKIRQEMKEISDQEKTWREDIKAG